MADSKDFTIRQGETFTQVIRWGTSTHIYKPIVTATQTAPARITCPSHSIPTGWKAAVVSVKGMTQINAQNAPPKEKDYRTITVIDADTVELNEVNSADYKPYISGGYLQFYEPVDLTGFEARMAIKDRKGGTVLLSLTTADTRIQINESEYTIALTISAGQTAALSFAKGVYDLEMVSPTGVVTTILEGTVTVTQEVTS